MIEALNGNQVLRLIKHGTPLWRYSDIIAQETLPGILGSHDDAIIWMANAKTPTIGHWTCVRLEERAKRVTYFSSYGGKPDEEKNRKMTEEELIATKQLPNWLLHQLNLLRRMGYSIHYNDVEYQKNGDRSQSCGAWVAHYLTFAGSVEDFNNYVDRMCKLFKTDYHGYIAEWISRRRNLL